jgi:hypothetical protein
MRTLRKCLRTLWGYFANNISFLSMNFTPAISQIPRPKDELHPSPGDAELAPESAECPRVKSRKEKMEQESLDRKSVV